MCALESSEGLFNSTSESSLPRQGKSLRRALHYVLSDDYHGFPSFVWWGCSSCSPHVGLGQTLHFIWRFPFLKVSGPKDRAHTLTFAWFSIVRHAHLHGTVCCWMPSVSAFNLSISNATAQIAADTWGWWHITAILVLGNLRQKGDEFKASLVLWDGLRLSRDGDIAKWQSTCLAWPDSWVPSLNPQNWMYACCQQLWIFLGVVLMGYSGYVLNYLIGIISCPSEQCCVCALHTQLSISVCAIHFCFNNIFKNFYLVYMCVCTWVWMCITCIQVCVEARRGC